MPSYVFSFRTKVDRQITAEQESAWPQWFQEIGASVLDFGHRVLRLSYRRAAELFEQHTGGWTLHQLRHSALTHAAEVRANTSTLLSYSGPHLGCQPASVCQGLPRAARALAREP